MADQKQTTSLATRDINSLLKSPTIAQQIKQALPKHLTAERLIRMARTAIQRGSGLAQCTPLSLLACVVECGQLGLEPDGVLGEIYIVPFKGRATIIVGYKGFMKLAFQTGDVYKITAHVVRKGEPFDVTYGTRPQIEHTPKTHGEENGNVNWVGAYAIAHFRDGHTDFEWLERADVMNRRSRSAAVRAGKKDSPWFTDEEAMWKKSAIRALANRLPKSATDQRLARAVAIDEMSDRDMLTPTATGFEISEEALSLNEDQGAGEASTGEETIQESREIEEAKKPAAGGTAKSSKRSVKPDPKSAGNPNNVPKANIPRGGDVIDVKAEKPKNDPTITPKQMTSIYEVADRNNSWTVESIRAYVKEKLGCKVSELKQSQLPRLLQVLESGE